MKLASDLLTVCAVLVGVAAPGTAYGHNAAGQCMAFTGEREKMLELFHLLRAYLKGLAPPVTVNPGDWSDLRAIERAECPNHMMPAITGEIAYYTPY